MITMRSTFLRLPTPQTSKVLQPNYTSTPLPTPRMLPRIPEPGRSSCPAPGACSLEHVLVWVWPGWFMSPAVPRFQHQASLISAQLLAANDSTSGQEASGQWSLALCPRWGPRDPRPGGLASSLSPQQLPALLTCTVLTLDSARRRNPGWVLESCTGTSGVRGHGDQGWAKRLTTTHRPRGGGGQRCQPVGSGPAVWHRVGWEHLKQVFPSVCHPPVHPSVVQPTPGCQCLGGTHRRSEGLGECGPQRGGKTPYPQPPSDPGRSGEHWAHRPPKLGFQAQTGAGGTRGGAVLGCRGRGRCFLHCGY